MNELGLNSMFAPALRWEILSISDIAFYLNIEVRSAQRKAKRQRWLFITQKAKRGKPIHFYPLKTLPPDVQINWAGWDEGKYRANRQVISKKNHTTRQLPPVTDLVMAKQAILWEERPDYFIFSDSPAGRKGPRQKRYNGRSNGLCPEARTILYDRFPELQSVGHHGTHQPELIPEIAMSQADSSSAGPVDKDLFTPLQPKRNFEEVASQIKELIFSKKLLPDDLLPPERELASMFGSSRNTVREAFRVLEESGFIEFKAGVSGGARVKKLDGHLVTRSLSNLIQTGQISLGEITQARLTIELAALNEIMDHLNEEIIDRLESCLNEAEMGIQDPNVPLKVKRQYYIDFHLLITSISKNRVYQYLLTSLMAISSRYIQTHFSASLEGAEEHINDHRKILDALVSGDKKKAQELLENHILRIESDISNQL